MYKNKSPEKMDTPNDTGPSTDIKIHSN